MELAVLAESLRTAFGDYMDVETLESELKLSISGKSAWINAAGRLSGESGIGSGTLEVGIDVIGSLVTTAASPIATGV